MYRDITLGFEFEVEGEYYDIYDLIDNSSHITGIADHCIHGYHDTDQLTARGKWRVEEDETIDGAEFISPPLGYHKAKQTCKEFFEAIEDTLGVSTTENCGLHVGISVNGDLKGVNLKTLIPNINYRLLTNLWSKRMIGHYHCKGLKSVLTTMNTNTFVGNRKLDILKLSNKCLTQHHSFISKKKYNNKEYLELRAPGGIDYHLKFKELFITIDHIADILLGNTKITKKQSNRKMHSYINRIYSRKILNHKIPNSVEEFKQLNPSIYAINMGYRKVTDIFKSADLYGISLSSNISHPIEKINVNNYLYYLIKSMIALNGEETQKELHSMSEKINQYTTVVIPKDAQQSDMIKMLKVWDVLPRQLVEGMIHRLKQKAFNHFIKYYINNTKDSVKSGWINNIVGGKINATL